MNRRQLPWALTALPLFWGLSGVFSPLDIMSRDDSAYCSRTDIQVVEAVF